MKETIIQNTIAIHKVLEALIEKYDLPKEEVFEIAMKVYAENMQYKPKND